MWSGGRRTNLQKELLGRFRRKVVSDTGLTFGCHHKHFHRRLQYIFHRQLVCFTSKHVVEIEKIENRLTRTEDVTPPHEELVVHALTPNGLDHIWLSTRQVTARVRTRRTGVKGVKIVTT